MSALVRGPIALSAVGLWFVTMVGGWSDLGAAIDRRLPGDRPDLLPSTVLATPEEFALPTRLAVHGDQLIVVDRYASGPILVIDRHTGRTLQTLGAEGDGPGEFRVPTSIAAHGSNLAILDSGLNRVTWLTPAGGGDAPYVVESTVQLSLAGVATDFSLTKDHRFVATGPTGTGLLVAIRPSGEPIRYIGRAPPDDHLTARARSEQRDWTLRATPAFDRYVLSRRFASRLFTLHPATSRQREVWGPDRFEPGPGRSETRFGYIDSAPTRNGFLALFSGRTREEYPGRANFGAEVHEFTWDGRFVGRYSLDSDVISIAWSEDDATLYAIRHDPVPAIVAYEIDLNGPDGAR